jgi:hypothetical protein
MLLGHVVWKPRSSFFICRNIHIVLFESFVVLADATVLAVPGFTQPESRSPHIISSGADVLAGSGWVDHDAMRSVVLRAIEDIIVEFGQATCIFVVQEVKFRIRVAKSVPTILCILPFSFTDCALWTNKTLKVSMVWWQIRTEYAQMYTVNRTEVAWLSSQHHIADCTLHY